jgi:phospholipase/carboxylesterase
MRPRASIWTLMSELKLAGLKVHLNRSSLSPSKPMQAAVVLLHGFGAPGTDLVSLGDVISVPEGTGMFFPEGPLDLGQQLGPGYGAARAWWPIDTVQLQVAMMTGQADRAAQGLTNGLEHARILVQRLLDDLESEFALHSRRIVLGGFSQGAVACLDVALRDTRELAGLLLLSGTMASPVAVSTLAPSRAGLPVLLSHGQSDPVLPYSIAEALRDQLNKAGWKVSWISFPGGHGIPLEVLRKASALIPEWLK